ncbi:NADPH:quinone reductase [Actinacidiphila bryophytorum]|uniref:NADPH:quinone reductase n=1 Tax=Actinacidiphila bryophytorum TaxID=1436133 RepID=UPI002176DB12|nr:NADPH:quinone reductase [Actinacidiphila bryophytorum]UWE10985.1 NADPH:quinone reductase [Actinacidiphila bryophytorum]
MRGAYVDACGPAEVIRVGEVAEPRVGGTDVVVDVEVSAVNAVDTMVRSGVFRTAMELPFVIGRDLVGTVAAAAPGVPGFRVGDRVWCNSMGHGGRQGAAAQRVAVPGDRLYRLPAGVDPVEAVAVVHPAATAYLALFTHGRLRAGETVVVAGGGGNVGGALITLAVHAGARVVATAGARDAERCRALGAVEVVDHHGPAPAKELAAACPQGAGLYVDTSGRVDLDLAVGLLAWRGRVVLLAGMGARPELPAGPLYVMDRSVIGFAISHATTAELAEAAAMVNRLLASGALRPSATHIMPLSAAAEAHRRVESGKVRGKIVLRVGPES